MLAEKKCCYSGDIFFIMESTFQSLKQNSRSEFVMQVVLSLAFRPCQRASHLSKGDVLERRAMMKS